MLEDSGSWARLPRALGPQCALAAALWRQYGNVELRAALEAR